MLLIIINAENFLNLPKVEHKRSRSEPNRYRHTFKRSHPIDGDTHFGTFFLSLYRTSFYNYRLYITFLSRYLEYDVVVKSGLVQLTKEDGVKDIKCRPNTIAITYATVRDFVVSFVY